MNAGPEKTPEALAAWERHYQRLGHQRTRRTSRIRHKRGFSARRLAFLLLALGVVAVGVIANM